MAWLCVVVVVVVPGLQGDDRWHHLKLHPEHLPLVLANDPHLAKECRVSDTCPFKVRCDDESLCLCEKIFILVASNNIWCNLLVINFV